MATEEITIFVGDITPYLAETAQKHDLDAVLITNKNYKELSPGTYYISIGDLDNLVQFASVLRQANRIIYAPPEKWSDQSLFQSSKQKEWIESYLTVFSKDPTKIVHGYEAKGIAKNSLELADTKRSEKPQIWIAGCSISDGMGVQQHERYGNIISEKLNLPVSFLTRSGSSIEWAADQILRSDLEKNDILFWGITNPKRFSFWDDMSMSVKFTNINKSHASSLAAKLITKEYFLSDHTQYKSITSIYQVINFCNKIGVKFILATLIKGIESDMERMPNFIPLHGIFGQNHDDHYIDLGSDGSHPGLLSHKFFADSMILRYYQVYGHNA